jgi:hypothetical protein
MLPSLWSVRSSPAQVALQVSSVNVSGDFDTGAYCPGNADDPAPTILQRSGIDPIVVTSHATASNGTCTSHAASQAAATIYQMRDGSIQITGSSSVSTLDSISPSDPPPEGLFASAGADSSLSVTVDLQLTRWSTLTFAGTMTVGTVTAVGSPEFSSTSQTQSWILRRPSGVILAERSLTLGSGDPDHTRQDIYYSSILAAPGRYTLVLTITGTAAGDIDQAGTSGWTSSGTFGIAVSTTAACVADFDQDGILDSRDFFEFLNAYFLDAADFNQDSVVDSRDFFDFLAAYFEGCP